jgi:uncharacterized membrane protein
MTTILISFANLLAVSLVVGAMFGIWLGYSPVNLSPIAYLEQQQHAIRALNITMPIFGAIGTLLTVASAVLAREDRLAFALLIAAVVCLLVAGLVTRVGNQPINAKVMTWSMQTMPTDWTTFRDDWWKWHSTRTLAGIVGLSLLILGTLVERR